MLKRLLVLAAAAALVVLALPALSVDQPEVAAARAKAPALTAAQSANLAKLQRLAAPDVKLTLAPGILPVFKPTTVKKEISCGVFVYPPNPNPMAVSPRLYWVNNTGQTLPPGVHIEWQVEGTPPSCCKGVTGATTQAWLPNPPSPQYFYSQYVLGPPQPWTRPCKAWVIIP